jgi:phosphoserine phosphatase
LITIGIDFDNTIVSYDELMYRTALDRGLITNDVERTKRAVRDRIRQMPDGEVEWQKLQALVYGPLMADARPTDGAEEFIRWCRTSGMSVFIVSHKTEYASYDVTRTNLRDAALDWMTTRRFFESDGLDLRREAVYFESTRADKIARIEAIGCSHFVDDLEEVFLEAAFPTNVHKILFSPGASELSGPHSSAAVLPTWRAVREFVISNSSGSL